LKNVRGGGGGGGGGIDYGDASLYHATGNTKVNIVVSFFVAVAGCA